MKKRKADSGYFIPLYRLSLAKDKRVRFETTQLNNPKLAHPMIRKLIKKHGQGDREQFCVVLLNAKNGIIGFNIVSTGDLTSASVSPREVLKPAILANASAMILCHNHPSGDLAPSNADYALTTKMVQAAKLLGIQVHEHLIISMDDDEMFYSFADNGLIKTMDGGAES